MSLRFTDNYLHISDDGFTSVAANEIFRQDIRFDGSAPKLSQATAIRGEERSIPVMGNPARNEGHATQAESKKQSAAIEDCRLQISDCAC